MTQAMTFADFCKCWIHVVNCFKRWDVWVFSWTAASAPTTVKLLLKPVNTSMNIFGMNSDSLTLITIYLQKFYIEDGAYQYDWSCLLLLHLFFAVCAWPRLIITVMQWMDAADVNTCVRRSKSPALKTAWLEVSQAACVNLWASGGWVVLTRPLTPTEGWVNTQNRTAQDG